MSLGRPRIAAEKLRVSAKVVQREHGKYHVRVERVESPEDFLPGLNGENAEGESLLALMQPEPVGQANRDAFVML
jgi:hypothetical protein